LQKRNDINPVVYIVIVNYKNWQDTVECIESVFRSSYKNFRIFVVDNDSQNESLQNLVNWSENRFAGLSAGGKNVFNNRNLDQISDLSDLPSLVFVQNEKNTGFAGGNNVILKILAGQDAYVWMLNPDMVITDNALSELVLLAQIKSPDTIIGPVVKFFNDPTKIEMYGGGHIKFRSGTISFIQHAGQITDLDYISGGAMFFHAGLLKKYGLLPENYFLYWEETDWCYGARMQGSELAVCERSVVYDKVGTSIGRSFMAEYYYTRNGLLFLHKYKRENIRTAIFYCRIRMIKKIFQGQWKRAKGVFRGAESFKKMISHGNK
jgi:GT2 family glycosyltransferase